MSVVREIGIYPGRYDFKEFAGRSKLQNLKAFPAIKNSKNAGASGGFAPWAPIQGPALDPLGT